MKLHVLLAMPLLLASAGGSQALMNRQTFLGTPLDPRVTRCGVDVEGDRMATLRPFLEASADLKGKYRVNLTKRSSSGTSTISQSNRFEGRQLGGSSLSVNRPASITVAMTVEADDGTSLCRLDASFDLASADGTI